MEHAATSTSTTLEKEKEKEKEKPKDDIVDEDDEADQKTKGSYRKCKRIRVNTAAENEVVKKLKVFNADDIRDDVEELAAISGAKGQLVPLETLQDDGILMADIKKFKDAGYVTVTSISHATKKELLTIKGIGDAKADKIILSALKLCPMSFISASTALVSRSNVVRISTGSRALDQLLEGGVETGSLTEIFGEFRTGKSQICHHLCVTCQLPQNAGGAGGKALYIDTEGTFRPERLTPIAERYGLNPKDVLNNVIFARCYNTDHQSRLVTECYSILSNSRVVLIVVDSFMNLYRSDYLGRGELAARQIHIAKQLRRLMELADQYDAAVVITNQVMADPGATPGMPQPPKPTGGNIMAHASTTRLQLRKGRAEERICKVYDSPCLPESEAVFTITNAGINDSES